MGGNNTTIKSVTKPNKTAPRADTSISTQKKLTQKQDKFIREYLANGYNATQAAIKAGYSKHAARAIATKLLTNAYIKDALAEYSKQEQAKFNYTKEEHFKELEELKQEAKRTGALAAAVKAAELKGKLCGLYIEKVETTIKEPRRFVVEIVKPK